MIFRRKFGRRRIYRKAGLRRRGYGKRKVSKSVKRYVKKTIHRQIENKEIVDYWNNQSLQTVASGTNTGDCVRQMLPLPSQGTQSNQRIGNNIRVVKGVIKGYVNLKPYDATFNPQGTPLLVKMFLFRDLSTTQTQPIQNGTYTTYFDNFFKGNGTNYPPQGLPFDMTAGINDTRFRILATKTFQLGATSVSSTGQVGSAGYFDNNRMAHPFYFNWAKYCKKVIKFEEGGSYPTNDNCYLFVQVVRADGTSSGGYKMAEWHAYNHIKFEDA